MPRKLTELEIQRQKDFMYKKAVQLIKEKGITHLTIEDITQATQMAKGSFYHYYSSKEIFLYEVIKRNEIYFYQNMLLEISKKIKANNKKEKEEITQVFIKYFLEEECLFAYLMPEDQEYLLRRLPDEVTKKEMNKSQANYQMISEMLNLKNKEDNYATLSYLMEGLQAILRSSSTYGEAGRKRAAAKIVNAIADFFMEEQK